MSGHENGHNDGHKELEEKSGKDTHKEAHDGENEAEENHEKSESEKREKKLAYFSDIVMLLVIAILGRVLLKTINQFNIPSVEPIIPIAAYAGMVYGQGIGAIVGFIAYPISSLLIPEVTFGMDAFWMASAGAIAGALGGFAKKISTNEFVKYVLIGTLCYEIFMNIPNQEILVYPYSFTHIISNAIFAYLIGLLTLKGK